MANHVTDGMGGTLRTGLTPSEISCINQKISSFENDIARILATASCKLSEQDAIDVIGNIDSVLKDIETIVDDKISKQNDIVSLINALENKVNGL